jgi:hypothetical protein
MSAYTQEQLTALRAAIAKGVTRLRMNGEEVQYRSLDEMMRLAAVMDRSLNGVQTQQHYPAFTRGT